MSMVSERRARMASYLQGSTKFHGEFKYPEECCSFAELAIQETVEMPPEDGYGFIPRFYGEAAGGRGADRPFHPDGKPVSRSRIRFGW